MRKFLLIFLFLSANLLRAQFYYGLQQNFGKNRVQYQPFYWTYFGFERYQVYMYEGGLELGKYVSKRMDEYLPLIEKKVDFQMENMIQVLVFTNQGDFRQTNLGLESEEGGGNLGGVTKVAGTKFSVYFNGNHADLDKQIRAGIAEVLLNEIMYGGKTRDMVKNSTLLVLPDWFKQGLVSYLSEEWSVDIDNKVMDAIVNDRYYNFNKLSGNEAVLAGHAFWHYVAETYGESIIPNILYMSKVSRNVENAVGFVLGTSVKTLTLEMIDSFARSNLNADTSRKNPETIPIIKKPKSYKNYYQLKINPDATKLAFVVNELSQYRVYIKDVEGKKKAKRIAKWGPKIERINDLTYPLLDWHPSGNALAMIHEKKGVIYLTTYQLDEDELFSKPITGIEKITDFGYSPDGKKIVFSGVKKAKGQSDIFVYTINAGGLEAITNDIWDDEQPRFVQKGQQIVFTSNRIHDTIKDSESGKYLLKQEKYHDVFLYNYSKKSKQLIRVTFTPGIHECLPNDYDGGYFTYVSEQNGIRNRIIAKLDSVISFVDTTEHYRYVFSPKAASNYKSNLQEQDFALKAGKIAEVFQFNGKNYFYLSEMKSPASLENIELQNTPYRRSILYAPKGKYTYGKAESYPGLMEKYKVNTDDYNFRDDNEKNKSVKKEVAPSTDSSKSKSSKEFMLPLQRNYFVNFSVDNVTSQLDNSFLNQTYQRFTGYYVNPGMNGFFKVSLSDLFEDYKIMGGFRITGNLNNEFFISVENRKKLIDKQLVLHRQSFLNINGSGDALLKIHTHDGQFKVKFPFSEVLALKATIMYRNDRTVFTSTDDINLPKKNTYDNWAGGKVEFIFDNTKSLGLNLYRGARMKIFGEYLRKIDVLNLGDRKDLIVFGADLRHYTRIHRNFIWANRFAASGSLGTNRLIYYLGGVDNWFSPKYDFNINILYPERYSFQTIATNMRGFKQNIRNGNNFAVFNSELRFPIFRYLMNRPIKSDFINNFQVVGFTDVGAAWQGASPFSEENTENKTYKYGNPISVILFQYKQPIIVGYGFGFRSRLFGYFCRLDFSWGIDNTTNRDRLTYLSFTTDF